VAPAADAVGGAGVIDQLIYALALVGLGFLMAVAAHDMNPPTPKTVFVPVSGLQVNCTEQARICYARKRSGMIKAGDTK
jgi:hypothetical protein